MPSISGIIISETTKSMPPSCSTSSACLPFKERKGADFRKQVVFEVDKLEYTSLDETFLQRAIDCVNAHLNDVEFGQAEFVSEMGASRTVLTEKLKSLTGLTPEQIYVINVAKELGVVLNDYFDGYIEEYNWNA